jgi:hypothetical protein
MSGGIATAGIKPVAPRLCAAVAALVVLGGSIALPAMADEYDDALRCVVLIGQAKDAYTADNVDALREAGDRLQARADAARPPNLTDQQAIDRLVATVDAVTEEGGIQSEWLRGEAVFCASMVGVDLTLPGGE